MHNFESTPSVAERYSCATQSGDLKLNDRRSDVDWLIAMGWLGNDLGSLLYRLRAEFDVARAARREPLAGLQLRNLRAAREAFRTFACQLATRTGFAQPNSITVLIADRVLAAFLDPTCPHCTGRGFMGGNGVPRVMCTHCRGGSRRQQVGHTAEERRFAESLLAEVDRKLDRVEVQLRRLVAS